MNYRNLRDLLQRGTSRLVLNVDGDEGSGAGGDPPPPGDAGGGAGDPPSDPPGGDPAADAPPAAADGAAGGDPPGDPAPPKPERTPWYTKRIDSLTAAQKAEKERADRAAEEAAEARRTAEAYRALYGDLQPGAPGAGAPPAAAPAAGAGGRTYSEADFQAAVQQQARLQSINQTLERWYEDGVKTGGDEFKQTIARAGQAFGQELAKRTDFFEALTSLPNGDKVYNQLAGDLDHMAEVLAMNPLQLGVELGRLSAAANSTAAPRGRPVSNAPAPIAPVDGSGGQKPFDPESSDMSAYVSDFEARRQRRFQERGH